jgi:hypothetical protein
MASGAVKYVYVPSFTKICSSVRKLIGGDTQTHTHRQQRDLIKPTLFFLK